MAALKKKMAKYKKGSKEATAATAKMKMLKWKLKHTKRPHIVKTVVKSEGKHAMKYAKKEKKKAGKLAMKVSAQRKSMAKMAKKMAKYKKGSKEFGAAMVKMKMLKWKLKHAKRPKT